MGKIKVLFVIKKRSNYGISYGLVNSCQFIKHALKELDVESKVVEVIDNSFIDAEVFNYKPTHVFIEALWVVPSKFEELFKYDHNKKAKWYIRIHSNTPFLAHEGIAFEWIKQYAVLSKKYKNFNISCNNTLLHTELKKALNIENVYAPNIYNPEPIEKPRRTDKAINIGCFGTIRPFKNHLEQAMGAILFSKRINKPINFHINASRLENLGEPVLKNLRAIFDGTKNKLIEHPWVNHEDFVKLVVTMDLGLQVSFTETFNIVAADFANNNIPIVGSDEIEWLADTYQAKPTSSENIANKLYYAYLGDTINLQYLNKLGLRKHNKRSLQFWKELLYC